MEWSREKIGDLGVLRMGSKAQPVLAKSGDDLRIDWGYLYAAAPMSAVTSSAIASSDSQHRAFVERGRLPAQDDSGVLRPANRAPLMAFVFDMGQVGAEPVARHLILAYDDLYPIEYFHQRLRPYWRRNGAQAADLLTTAERDYNSLRTESEEFDSQLMADLTRVGGEKYARLAALAYRQSLAAHKLVAAPDGQTPYYFPKENFSCGCISTVDVIYPAAPVLLLVNPHLVEASLAPVMDYVKAGKWPFPYAPHDLGTFPLANGRDPAAIETMPVEESGNILILFAAIARAEGNTAFAGKYAPILQQWADYLAEKGLDPENQLCTDDFAGHLAHNTNLSIKAILGLGSYAQILDMRGKTGRASLYRTKAQELARRWVEIQSGVGQNSGLESLPRGSGSEGNRLLRKPPQPLRPASRQSQDLYETRLGALDRHPGGVAGRLGKPYQADLRLGQPIAHPSSPHRLVLDSRRHASGVPSAFRGGRDLHQDAVRPCHLEVMGRSGKPLS